MCGIAGIVGKLSEQTDLGVLTDMQKTLIDRGPDQQSTYIDEDASLIHTRLCVIDIENGKQPMVYERGNEKYVIVYNGELYNTEDIRKELIGEGFTFKGHSDTEVLLKAYVRWGRECLTKLNGIFAFAIWERHNKRLFFARDRMGVKPLFYAQTNNSILFASEIKTLLKHPSIEAKINTESIAEILLIGPGRTSGYGVFLGIDEVPPGHCGTFDSINGTSVKEYWKIKGQKFNDTPETAIEKVRYLVTDAIKRQLVSDVPICGFLSGGLDSSIIATIATLYSAKTGQSFRTFSVNYAGNDKNFKASKYQPNGDADFIKIMNEYLDVRHDEIIIDTPELIDALYDAVEARDLPGMADVDSSLLLFCKQVKEQCTVALSGECSDEIFGGYPWYTDEKLRTRKGFPWSQSTTYRASFIKRNVLGDINPEDYVNSKYEAAIKKADLTGISDDNKSEINMRRLTQINMDWFMQTLLDRKDRMSMFSGLEVRVPFCDHRIAEYLYNVPWDIKYLGGNEKGLLRAAMGKILPTQIAMRKKSPYPKTHNPDFLKAVSKEITEVLADSSAPIHSLLDKEKVLELIRSEGESMPWYGQLMQKPQTLAYFLQINYWLSKFKVSIV